MPLVLLATRAQRQRLCSTQHSTLSEQPQTARSDVRCCVWSVACWSRVLCLMAFAPLRIALGRNQFNDCGKGLQPHVIGPCIHLAAMQNNCNTMLLCRSSCDCLQRA